MKIVEKILLLIVFIYLSAGCSVEQEEVVVYCSLDRMFSEPILKSFEEETGLKVKAVYDTELTKTIGLVNRIIAEASKPQCDVFWNNEISRTIALYNKKLIQPYDSPNAANIPIEFKDDESYWTGFAARGRVIIYNKDKIPADELPTSIFDLTDPHWKGKAAMAYPFFGTTATHVDVLFAELGNDGAIDFFNAIIENKTAILDGNATVRDQVASGNFYWGLTDTDDANGAIEDGKNVGIIYPDQNDGQIGTLIIPNTLAIIKNCQNFDNAKKLVDYILRPETEILLANSRSAQIPVRQELSVPDKVMDLNFYKTMKVDFKIASKNIEENIEILKEIFTK